MAKKILSFSVLVCFFLTTLSPIPKATASPNLPQNNILSLTPAYAPLLVKGMTIYPENPFQFDFIVDTGKSGLSGQALNDEAMKMIKYFLASLTVPEKEMWVNLSPLEKNRIVPESFGQTDMGRDLLAQDYMLKKLTASLIYPESQLGKEFWSKIYSQIESKFGTTNVPVNTFNKVWIVPATASVYEHGNHVYVVNSHLKVMLESDYNAMQRLGHQSNPSMSNAQAEMTKNIIRQVILPAIEKEVNEGEHFVLLRQMYTTMILASWYKNKLHNSLLNQVYSNKDKITGIDIADKNAKEEIYRSYLETFKKGVYNYIKEEIDPSTNQIVPKKYFSGGANLMLDGIGGVAAASATQAAMAVEASDNTDVIRWKATDAAAISTPRRNLESAYYFGIKQGAVDPTSGEVLPIYAGDQNQAKEDLGGKGEGLARMSSPENQKDFGDYVHNSGLLRTRSFVQKVFAGDPTEEKETLDLLGNESFLNSLGFNVPAGFTLPTTETVKWDERMKQGEASVDEDLRQLKAFLKDEAHIDIDDPRNAINWDLLKGLSADSAREYLKRLKVLELDRGPLGGTTGYPFTTAVRSGASVSMPGMMDTILNLGLNDDNIGALLRKGQPEAGAVVTEEDKRFAYDTYRRFIEMFGKTVLGVHDDAREGFTPILKKIAGDRNITRLDADDYKLAIELYKEELQKQGKLIPNNPYLQYLMAIVTVMRSTFSDRALEYRVIQKLDLAKTISAVNIVPMVSGNRNKLSGTGVAFSRDVDSGEDTFKGEFAAQTQGEDVVNGTINLDEVHDIQYMLRKPETREAALRLLINMEFLEHNSGDAQDVEFTYENNEQTGKTTLYMLQTRNAKRNASSAINIAKDLVEEETAYQKRLKGGDLTAQEEAEIKYRALKTIDPNTLRDLLVPVFDQGSKKAAKEAGKLMSSKGTKASSGAGVGAVVFSSKKAKEIVEKDPKAKVILITEETTTHDIGGMNVSQAILTLKGGFTSHAAVVARQMGIPAIVSVQNMKLVHEGGNIKAVFFVVRDGKTVDVEVNEGELLAVDATNVEIYKVGSLDEIKPAPSPLVLQQNYNEGIPRVRQLIEQNKILAASAATPGLKAEYEAQIAAYEKFISASEEGIRVNKVSESDQKLYENFRQIQQWAGEVRGEFGGLGIRANAEDPLDVLNAVLFGAEGLGLVRTEHMFMKESRLLTVQKMIVSLYNEKGEIDADARERLKTAMAELLPFQQSDFEQIFMILDGKPATIRLLDPPMHEILPNDAEQLKALAVSIYGENVTEEQIAEISRKVDFFRESNPMFGTRGVRLGILIPELIEMQARAIFNAQQRVRSLIKEDGTHYQAHPEIMIPLVGNVEEFEFAGNIVQRVAREMGLKRHEDYLLGTMIEIIAGVLNAKRLAEAADFFSFGTNDETQGTLGLSRDDGAEYIAKLLQLRGTDSPFASLDSRVAEFTLMAVQEALSVNPKFKLGICGDQGTDPNSIINYLAKWLTYVSGNARSLPGANIAAAGQAKVKKVVGVSSSEPKINITKYADVGIPKGESIENQLSEAVAFLNEQDGRNATPQNIKAVLAQLELPQDSEAYKILESNPDFQKLITLVQSLQVKTPALRQNGRMTVQLATGDASKVNAQGTDGIGFVNLDKVLASDSRISEPFLEYLLVRAGNEALMPYTRLIDALKLVLPERLGKAGQNKELSFALPSQPLSSFFEFDNASTKEAVLRKLAGNLNISYEEALRRAAIYHESNPVIGERGARLISKQATGDLYDELARASIIAAHDAGYTKVNLILPFIEGSTHMSEILDGRKNGQETVFPSLNAAIKEAVRLTAGKVEVNIGASIDVPSATAIKGGAADIASQIRGPIVIDIPELTRTVWSIHQPDFFKPGAVGPKYVEQIWGDRNIFDHAPEDVRRLVRETIRKIKSNPEYKGQVLIFSSNPLDADLLRDVRSAGADGIIIPGQEPYEAHAALLSAAKVSALYAVANPAMTAEAFIALDDATARKETLDGMDYLQVVDLFAKLFGIGNVPEEITAEVRSAISDKRPVSVSDGEDREFEKGQVDSAQGAIGDPGDPLGGINFDAGMLNMTIKRDGSGMPLPVYQQNKALVNLPGLRPVIINIQQSVNVSQMLGFAAANDNIAQANGHLSKVAS